MNALIEFLNLWGERAIGFAWPMLWQSSLLITVLFAFDFVFRRKVRASIRYALWLVVLLKLLLPPSIALPTSLAWWVRPAAQTTILSRLEQPTTFLVTYSDVMPSTAPLRAEPVFVAPPRPTLSPAGWRVLGWAAISAWLLAWMLVRWRKVACDVRQATPASDRLRELLIGTRSTARVSRCVELRVTTRAMSPAVCGLLRPVILLPQSLVARLSSEQLRAVLLHELVHLRRGDVWVNCLQALLQIAYWWHPLLWLANARIRRVREEAVDDAVMLTLADHADAYAPMLLEVAKLAFNRPLPSLGLVGILESRSALRQRIERLVDYRPPRKAGLTIAPALCVVSFAALAVPMEKAPALAERTRTRTATDLPQGEGKQDSAERTNFVSEKGLSTTDLIYITKGRQRILERLNAIRLNSFSYHGETLEKVVGDLNEEAKRLDTQKRGINFVINPAVEPSLPRIDSGTGLSLPGVEPFNLKSLRITIEPPLTDVRLADVLDAIVGATGHRVNYSIEDYAVVFSQRVPGVEPLYTQTFKVNADQFFEELQKRGHLDTQPPEQQPGVLQHRALKASIAIQSFIRSSGVDFNPLLRKSTFWNDRSGILMVRATEKDLEAIEQALQKLLASPSESATEPTNRVNSAGAQRETSEIGKGLRVEVYESNGRHYTLYRREFNLDPKVLRANLRKQGYLANVPIEQDRSLARQEKAYSSEDITQALREFFLKAGVSLKPTRFLSFSGADGTLVIEATVQEFNIIEQALPLLSANPKPQIKIEARFVEMSTNLDSRVLNFNWPSGNKLLKDRISTNAPGKGPPQIYGILTDPQYRVVLRAWEQRSGVDILSAPRVTTISGRQAQIQVADTQTVVTGINPQALIPPGIVGGPNTTNQLYQTSTVRFGPVLDVTPTLSADGYTISLNVNAAVTEFLGYDEHTNFVTAYINGKRERVAQPLPRFRVRESSATASVWDGQTLLLFNPLEYMLLTKPNGDVDPQEVADSERKPLLVFATVRLVDESGNPVHTDDEMPFSTDSIPQQPLNQK